MRREKNILQSIWEGKKYPAHQVARKKNLADQKSPNSFSFENDELIVSQFGLFWKTRLLLVYTSHRREQPAFQFNSQYTCQVTF